MTDNSRQSEFEVWVDETFMALLGKAPEIAEQMGVFVGSQEGKAGKALTDYSSQACLHRYNMMQSALTELKYTDQTSLSENDQITYRCFEEFLKYSIFPGMPGIERNKFTHHDYPVDHESGRQLELPIFLTTLHVISDSRTAANYLSRLSSVADAINVVIDRVKENEKHGVIAPRITLSKSVEGLKDFVSTPIEDNPLYTALRDALVDMVEIGVKERANFLERAKAIINDDVVPVYQVLLSVISQQVDKASDKCGLWAMSGGASYYEHLIRSYTTLDITPAEIHKTGLREAKKLQDELTAELEALGYVGGSFQENIEKCFEDTDYYLEDTEENRAFLLSECKRFVYETEKRLPEMFDVVPSAKVRVLVHPKYAEKTRTHRYNPPAANGGRSGTFELNLAQQLQEPIFSLPTLAYHEAVPGHHLQLAIAQEAKSLGIFRRTYVATSYIEGWAKYAEKLPWEFGLNRDPRWGIHRKQRELVSTVNLIVDTGIHDKRWSREKAIGLYNEYTGVGEILSERIIDRLIACPAQLVAYKIGLIMITELREEYERTLGSEFNIKKFHHELLRHGSLPLPVLKKVMKSNLTMGDRSS